MQAQRLVRVLGMRRAALRIAQRRRLARPQQRVDVATPSPRDPAQEQRAQEAYLAGNGLVNWLSWVSAGLVGVALANFIPTAWGLGFAGILCLVGILCSLASSRLRVLAAAVAGVVGVVAYALPLKLNIVAAIAVAVLVSMSAEHLSKPHDPQNPQKGAA